MPNREKFPRNHDLIFTKLSLYIALIVFMMPESAQNQNIWTEEWDEGWQDRWSYFAAFDEDCDRVQSGVLIQECAQTGFVSKQRFPVNQRIEFSGTLFTRPSLDSDPEKQLSNPQDFLGHHALFSIDDGPDGEYCGIYIWYDPHTRKDRVMIISYPHHAYPDVDLDHSRHEVKIIWVPSGERTPEGKKLGTCFYFIDGQQVFYAPYGFVQDEVTLWQGATSLKSGERPDGSLAYVEHGPPEVKVGR